MSNRTLVELNHDFCPNDSDEGELLFWARQMTTYMRTGPQKALPDGVTFKHFRHHSDPDPLDKLKEIFVFGSNEAGIHGAGAAAYARTHCGAIVGKGYGPQGSSFAIPTCKRPVGSGDWQLPLGEVDVHVKRFIEYAERSNFSFKITQVGCGLAGWRADEIAALFLRAPDNCSFDTAWFTYLGPKRKYWGTF